MSTLQAAPAKSESYYSSYNDVDLSPTSHGSIARHFVKQIPERSNLRKYGCQVFIFAVFIVLFGIMIYPCAKVLGYYEYHRVEVVTSLLDEKSSDEVDYFRGKYEQWLYAGLEQENLTRDFVDNVLTEFFEKEYIQRYHSYDNHIKAIAKDVQRVTPCLLREWYRIETIMETILSTMMLTASNSLVCKTFTCQFIIFGIAIISSFMFAVIFAACSGVIVKYFRLFFQTCFTIKTKAAKEASEHSYIAKFNADFAMFLVVAGLCAGSIVLGAIAMKNDQARWTFSEAIVYTISQGITLGNTQLIPDRSWACKQTLYSNFFYAIIRIHTMLWISCFIFALLVFGNSLEKTIRNAGYQNLLKKVYEKDRILMQQKALKHTKK